MAKTKRNNTMEGQLGVALFSIEAMNRGFHVIPAGEGLKFDTILFNPVTGEMYKIQNKYIKLGCGAGKIYNCILIQNKKPNKRKFKKDGTKMGQCIYSSYSEKDFDYLAITIKDTNETFLIPSAKLDFDVARWCFTYKAIRKNTNLISKHHKWPSL